MSNLEKWCKAILQEDADKMSIGSVRTIQLIKQEFERLQKENIDLQKERDGWKKSNENSYNLWHEQEAENRGLSKQLEYSRALYKALEKYTEDPYQSLDNYKAWQQLKLNQP